jgi:hypothetical protein
MQACAAGYAITYITTLKLHLASWTVVELAAAKFIWSGKLLLALASIVILGSESHILLSDSLGVSNLSLSLAKFMNH